MTVCVSGISLDARSHRLRALVADAVGVSPSSVVDVDRFSSTAVVTLLTQVIDAVRAGLSTLALSGALLKVSARPRCYPRSLVDGGGLSCRVLQPSLRRRRCTAADSRPNWTSFPCERACPPTSARLFGSTPAPSWRRVLGSVALAPPWHPPQWGRPSNRLRSLAPATRAVPAGRLSQGTWPLPVGARGLGGPQALLTPPRLRRRSSAPTAISPLPPAADPRARPRRRLSRTSGGLAAGLVRPPRLLSPAL